MPAEELLKTYVILYNYGVETDDFEPLMELFDDDSILEFENEKIGSFKGKDDICRMFRLQMPSNKIELTNVQSENNEIAADFYLEEDIEIRVGGLILYAKGNKIARLVVTI